MIKNTYSKFQNLAFCVLLSIFPLTHIFAITPSSEQNYIITYTPNIATTDISNLADTSSCPVIRYFDGLGRPSQIVNVGITPTGNDLVTNQEYDESGRPYKTWLPVVNSGGGGAYINSISSLTSNLYGAETKPCSINIYDGSPLNRIAIEYGPGANWQANGKGVAHDWKTNNKSTAMLMAYNFTVDNSNYLVNNGLYETGQLYVEETADEDGKKSWTFTDKLGQKILTRTLNGTSEYCSTYYVYDNFHRLRYVLPPMAANGLTTTGSFNLIYSNILKNYAYNYLYDSHGNCIEKKLPGAEPQYMVYDKADRLVLFQDANQRLKSQSPWTYIKYDSLGRAIKRGYIPIPSTSHSSLVSNYSTQLVVEEFTGNTADYGYTNTFFNGAGGGIYEIQYYDNYSFRNSSWLPGTRINNMGWLSSRALDKHYVNSSNLDISAKGLKTGSITFLSCNSVSKKAISFFYDSKGRVVEQNGTNHFNPGSNSNYGYDLYSYAYDFKGNILHTKHYQIGNYKNILALEGTKMTYDHAGRLLFTRHYFNSESAAVTTSTNTYNELGQLSKKVYGNNLETQTFSYNLRGCLQEMSGSLFSEKLYYEKDRNGDAGLYNGNIYQYTWNYLTGTAIHQSGWKSNPNIWKNNQRTFTLTYDNLNRMTSGSCDDTTSFSEELSYDKQGNILSLVRGGITEINWQEDGITPNHTTAYVDNLLLYYNGNQLSHIQDNSHSDQNFTGGQDFKQYHDSYNQYRYDNNGNMTTDLNKNITTIKYNYLNLPDTVQMSNGDMIDFGYDATGTKTFSTHSTANSSSSGVTMPIGYTLKNNTAGITTQSSETVMYLDNMIYENWNLDKIQITDGLLIRSNAVTATTPTFTYNYYVKDHLGNIRAVFHDAGNGTPIVDQVNNYYPFGMEYGESAEDTVAEGYQNYLFSGKEFDRKFEVNTYDFGARSYDATESHWLSIDPLAEKHPETSPYAYCSGNPINRIDPDGRREWPINETYKGYKRTHSNNWGDYRSSPKPHHHAGDDMNFKGAGNGDNGAPIVSTHDGYVSSVKTIESGDKNAGGTRITVTSEDGSVSTTYMHLSQADVKIGVQVSEGQQIGEMGRSGFGKADAYNAHLHYELRINGENVNPVGENGNLIDPQRLIAPAASVNLPEVIISAQGGSGILPISMSQLPVSEVKAPEKMPTQQ